MLTDLLFLDVEEMLMHEVPVRNKHKQSLARYRTYRIWVGWKEKEFGTVCLIAFYFSFSNNLILWLSWWMRESCKHKYFNEQNNTDDVRHCIHSQHRPCVSCRLPKKLQLLLFLTQKPVIHSVCDLNQAKQISYMQRPGRVTEVKFQLLLISPCSATKYFTGVWSL